MYLGVILPVHAQVERTGGGPGAQVMQQFQQAVSERSALQAENAKVKRDLEDARKQLTDANRQVAKLQAAAGSAQEQVAAANTARKSSDEAVSELRTKLQELIVRFRDITATLAGVEADRDQVKQQLATSIVKYDHCAEQNVEISELANQAFDRLDHQGVLSSLARTEPFTRIQRTRLENLVDEYRERTLELRVTRQGTGKDSAAAPTSAAKP